ncbi:MAG: hypothetical protein IJZ10_02260 [Thermoguttaceae bacterium]|nr:hypothetical protein [Thermoguttaceae bacterium]
MAEYYATIKATLKRRAKCYFCGATYTYETDGIYTTSGASGEEAEGMLRRDCESGRTAIVFAATRRNVPCPRCGRWSPGSQAGELVCASVFNIFPISALTILACAVAAFSGEDEATARLLVRVAAFLPLVAACLGIYRLGKLNANPERTLRRYNFNRLRITLDDAARNENDGLASFLKRNNADEPNETGEANEINEANEKAVVAISNASFVKRCGAALLFLPAILSGYWAVCATPDDALGTAGIPGLAVAAVFLAGFTYATWKMAENEPKIEVEDELVEARAR